MSTPVSQERLEHFENAMCGILDTINKDLPEFSNGGTPDELDVLWKIHTVATAFLKTLRWAQGKYDQSPAEELRNYMDGIQADMAVLGAIKDILPILNEDMKGKMPDLKWKNPPDFGKAFGGSNYDFAQKGGIN